MTELKCRKNSSLNLQERSVLLIKQEGNQKKKKKEKEKSKRKQKGKGDELASKILLWMQLSNITCHVNTTSGKNLCKLTDKEHNYILLHFITVC